MLHRLGIVLAWVCWVPAIFFALEAVACAIQSKYDTLDVILHVLFTAFFWGVGMGIRFILTDPFYERTYLAREE